MADIFWRPPPDSPLLRREDIVWYWDGRRGWALQGADYREVSGSYFTPAAMDC